MIETLNIVHIKMIFIKGTCILGEGSGGLKLHSEVL